MPMTVSEIPIGATLTEEQARAIFAQGEAAVVFALMLQAKMLAERIAAAAGSSHQTPSTPSGMKPVYQKPNGSSRKRFSTTGCRPPRISITLSSTSSGRT